MISINTAREKAETNQYEIDRHARAIKLIEKYIDKAISNAAYYGERHEGFSCCRWFNSDPDRTTLKLSDWREVAEKYRAEGYKVTKQTSSTHSDEMYLIIEW